MNRLTTWLMCLIGNGCPGCSYRATTTPRLKWSPQKRRLGLRQVGHPTEGRPAPPRDTTLPTTRRWPGQWRNILLTAAGIGIASRVGKNHMKVAGECRCMFSAPQPSLAAGAYSVHRALPRYPQKSRRGSTVAVVNLLNINDD